MRVHYIMSDTYKFSGAPGGHARNAVLQTAALGANRQPVGATYVHAPCHVFIDSRRQTEN
ncbi:hypothetical protein SXCC_00648 [Gluconacetobacter sp. SXCC-1]|nr:hypothetical protein SXCC_00648 [Gluconacetobacter sp. SXCC-1]